MKAIFALILIFSLTVKAQAQAPRVLSFSKWKAQQVTEAQNSVARVSNKLTLMKSDQVQKDIPKPLEQEFEAATQNLEIAKEYTIDHYVATYLSQYADSREALLELSQVTAKEEMADLLAAILKVRPNGLTTLTKPAPQTF